MQRYPDKWYLASDFQHGKYFVGYEAPTRLGDLQRDGLIESRWSKKHPGRKEYKLLDH